MLKARLAERARLEREAHLNEIRGEKGEAAWGRQVRSYVLQPYQMVKDLRTNHEVGNVQGVLDGDLQGSLRPICVIEGPSTRHRVIPTSSVIAITVFSIRSQSTQDRKSVV